MVWHLKRYGYSFFSGGADSILCLIFLLTLHKNQQKLLVNSQAFPTDLSVSKAVLPASTHNNSVSFKRQLIIYYLDHGQKFSPKQIKLRKSVFDACRKFVDSVIYDTQNDHSLCVLSTKWLSQKRDISVMAKKLNTSFERTGSLLRNKQMQKLAAKYKGCVITGHQLSDWYETLLMRLNRGSSFSKLIPFNFCEDFHPTGFRHTTMVGGHRYFFSGIKKYHPLFLAFRHEVRDILKGYNISYWDDPYNKNISVLRNLIRKKYIVHNYPGLRKTAQNFLRESNFFKNSDFSYEIIAANREVRILCNENYKKKHGK